MRPYIKMKCDICKREAEEGLLPKESRKRTIWLCLACNKLNTLRLEVFKLKDEINSLQDKMPKMPLDAKQHNL